MSDQSIIAPIMSSLVGLMGALVLAVSVYFSYKGRHNQFRQVVYGRQMDAYFDITESMAALYTAAPTPLAFHDPRLRGGGARERLRTALRAQAAALTGTVNAPLVGLPAHGRPAGA